MKEALIASLASMAPVVAVFLFSAAFRVAAGYDAPLGEVTIVTLGGIAGARSLQTGYATLQVKKEEMRITANREPAPPWTP